MNTTKNAPCQDRTGDLQIMRLTLYQLSQRSCYDTYIYHNVSIVSWQKRYHFHHIQTRPSSHDNDLIVCVSSTTSSTTPFTDSSTVIACSNERYFSTYAHGCYLEHCHDFNATPMLHTFQPYGRPLWWTTTLLIHRATSSVPNVGKCDAKLESCTWPIVIYQAIYEPD